MLVLGSQALIKERAPGGSWERVVKCDVTKIKICELIWYMLTKLTKNFCNDNNFSLP